MTMYKKILFILVSLIFVAVPVLAQATVGDRGTVRVRYAALDGYEITVNTTKTYVSFNVIIENAPAGNYTIRIPQDKLNNLICAPGLVTLTSTDNINLVCIARPARATVDLTVVRVFNDTTEEKVLKFYITTVEIWYETWSGGIESDYYITNGEYIIEHKPRQLVSQIIVKKGNNVIFTGLLFPGQEEKITDDLRIKFYGAIDNVTYMKVYTTSDSKFSLVETRPVVTINIPECSLEENFIVLKYTIATVIYTDGTNETVNATDSVVKLRRQNVARVICGKILELAPIQPTQRQEMLFIVEPKPIYYVGDPVVITAKKEFEIRCTDGTFERTRAFTKVFTEPATCTVILDDEARTFSVREKQAVTPQPIQPTQPQQPIVVDKMNERQALIIATILVIAILAYIFYERRKKGKEKEGSEEDREVEYRVKSALEGEQ